MWNCLGRKPWIVMRNTESSWSCRDRWVPVHSKLTCPKPAYWNLSAECYGKSWARKSAVMTVRWLVVPVACDARDDKEVVRSFWAFRSWCLFVASENFEHEPLQKRNLPFLIVLLNWEHTIFGRNILFSAASGASCTTLRNFGKAYLQQQCLDNMNSVSAKQKSQRCNLVPATWCTLVEVIQWILVHLSHGCSKGIILPSNFVRTWFPVQLRTTERSAQCSHNTLNGRVLHSLTFVALVS